MVPQDSMPVTTRSTSLPQVLEERDELQRKVRNLESQLRQSTLIIRDFSSCLSKSQQYNLVLHGRIAALRREIDELRGEISLLRRGNAEQSNHAGVA